MRRPFSGLTSVVIAACLSVAAGYAQAAPISGQGTWETTLLGRDINGHPVDASSASAVFLYDTTLRVTWLRNGNVNGFQNWETAQLWAGSLTVGSFGGWRLPEALDTGLIGDCEFSYSGTDCGWNVKTKSGDVTKYQPGQTVYSEFAHLFFVTLGNLSYYDTSGVPIYNFGLRNTGPFEDLIPSAYWYGTGLYGFESTVALSFDPVFGLQNGMFKFDSGHAIAVRDGDVCSPFPGGGATGGCFPGPFPFPAPEPGTLALLAGGLLGLGAARRRWQ